MNEFVIFILSHGRAENVSTYKSLLKHGYTGKVIIVIDNEDSQADLYYKNFKHVEIFNKKEIAKTFDEGDNFNDRRAIIYARNVCFEIAKKLGYKYFIELDDDYTRYEYRIYNTENQKPKFIKDLNSVFLALLDFYKNSPFATISIAQGGDFIGGKNNIMAKKPTIFRKCMNSFICSTERPFQFIGRINEDVNTYVNKQSIGLLMGTIPLISLVQKTTQKNKGGMTELYLDNGTYVKSFYSVMYNPSCCTIKPMGDKHMRLHHSINWDSAVPKIISEDLKK
jgi:hypothetical protein